MSTSLKNKKGIQKAFQNLLEPASREEKLELETLMLSARFLSAVEQVCQKRNILKKDLALMIGTSPSYITQLFRGNKIINLETIARMQLALNIEFKINLTSEVPSNEPMKTQKNRATYRSLRETRLVSQVKETELKGIKRTTRSKGPIKNK